MAQVHIARLDPPSLRTMDSLRLPRTGGGGNEEGDEDGPLGHHALSGEVLPQRPPEVTAVGN